MRFALHTITDLQAVFSQNIPVPKKENGEYAMN